MKNALQKDAKWVYNVNQLWTISGEDTTMSENEENSGMQGSFSLNATPLNTDLDATPPIAVEEDGQIYISNNIIDFGENLFGQLLGIHAVQQLALLVIANQRRGLFRIFGKTSFECFGIIVNAAYKHSAAAWAVCTRITNVQTDANNVAARFARGAIFNARTKRGDVGFKQQHNVKRLLSFSEHLLQRFGLTKRARIAVKNETIPTLLAEPRGNYAVYNFAAYKISATRQVVSFDAQRSACGFFFTEHGSR